MLDRKFLRNAPLPDDLSNEEIYLALQKTQELIKNIREGCKINLSKIIQANNFSGVVSNVFTKMLNDVSKYKLNDDQKYPDLIHETKNIGLEIKSSKNAFKGGEGHNGHTGWHIIACYKILENGDIEFIHVEIAYLKGYECSDSDWRYMPSKRNANLSQRTETYTTTDIGTAKLRDGTVYLNDELITISPALRRFRKKLIPKLPIPSFSPFAGD